PDQRPLSCRRDLAGAGAVLQRADGGSRLRGSFEEDVRVHQVNRMRGSRSASRTAEVSMPIKVRTPIKRMKLPARYMSCDISALSRRGPAGGRLSTMAVMVTPETSSGSTQPIADTKGFNAMRTGYFTTALYSGRPLAFAVIT